MNSERRVAIVGGGYAGMAAAATLADRGVPVTVFEAAKQLGGRARRVDYGDLALDNGLHILIGAYQETQRLMRLVGAPREATAFLRLPLTWRVHGEMHLGAPRLPAPWHLLVAVLSATGLSIGEKVSALRFMARQRRRRFKLQADVGVAQLLRDCGQTDRLCRLLWYPLCIATLNTPVEFASAQVFLNVLRDGLLHERAASDLLLPRIDLSALFPEPAARFIEQRGATVLRACTIDTIERGGDAYRLRAGGETFTFSQVICALPPHRVGAAIAALPELAEAKALIDAFDYQPIVSVYLQYPPQTTLPAPMIGLSARHTQWVFDRGLLCGQRGLIGVVISAASAQREIEQAMLAREVHEELRNAFGTLPQPAWHRVIAEKRATFSCRVGLRRPSQRTALPNFFLAGDYTRSDYPATLEAAVASGVFCARAVLGEA